MGPRRDAQAARWFLPVLVLGVMGWVEGVPGCRLPLSCWMKLSRNDDKRQRVRESARRSAPVSCDDQLVTGAVFQGF